MELIQWKELSNDYEKELKSESLATDVFSAKTEKGNKRWADLKNRVAEHVCNTYFLNIFICTKDYYRI